MHREAVLPNKCHSKNIKKHCRNQPFICRNYTLSFNFYSPTFDTLN